MKRPSVQNVFRLFIEGDRAPSRRARAQAQHLCRNIPGGATIEVIDVAKNPEIAFRERLFTLPVLVRLHPLPVTRLVEDLSDTSALFMHFGVLQRAQYVTSPSMLSLIGDDGGHSPLSEEEL